MKDPLTAVILRLVGSKHCPSSYIDVRDNYSLAEFCDQYYFTSALETIEEEDLKKEQRKARMRKT